MFSKRLKHLRKSRKLTQAQMADMLGISRQGYAKYENNSAQPDLDTLVKLADFFNVTTDYLLGKSNDPQLTADQEEKILKEVKKIRSILSKIPDGPEKERIIKKVEEYAQDLVIGSKARKFLE